MNIWEKAFLLWGGYMLVGFLFAMLAALLCAGLFPGSVGALWIGSLAASFLAFKCVIGPKLKGDY